LPNKEGIELLKNANTGEILAIHLEFATTFRTRLKGLMGRRSLPEGTALVIQPCSAIHTFFMRFPIDVLFLNANLDVLAVIYNMPSCRFSQRVKSARMVVEFPGGTISKTKTMPGHRIIIQQRGESNEN